MVGRSARRASSPARYCCNDGPAARPAPEETVLLLMLAGMLVMIVLAGRTAC